MGIPAPPANIHRSCRAKRMDLFTQLILGMTRIDTRITIVEVAQ
jgi:hypothetical protein